MAIIPGGQQIRTTSADVDLTPRGNALVKAQNQVYTMDDIVETVNAEGGGSLPYQSSIIKITQSGSDTPSASFLLNEIGISFSDIYVSTGKITLRMPVGVAPSDENTMMIAGDFHNGFSANSTIASAVHNGQDIVLRTYFIDNGGALQLTTLGYGGTESIIIEVRDFS
jgi:hypothetical protein